MNREFDLGELKKEEKVRKMRIMKALRNERVSRYISDMKDIVKNSKKRESVSNSKIKISIRAGNITHSVKESVLHGTVYNYWLRSRYKKSASTDYIFTPKEINKALSLKTIFKNFDDDGNGELDIKEFLSMFMETYVLPEPKINSYAPETADQTTNPDPSPMNIIKMKRMEDLKKFKIVEDFLEKSFKQYYNFITDKNYILLDDFISLSVDLDASMFFKKIMGETRDLLRSLDISPRKVIPFEFNVMINYLGYVSLRNQKLNEYRESIRHGQVITAFDQLTELYKIAPGARKTIPHKTKVIKVSRTIAPKPLRRMKVEVVQLKRPKQKQSPYLQFPAKTPSLTNLGDWGAFERPAANPRGLQSPSFDNLPVDKHSISRYLETADLGGEDLGPCLEIDEKEKQNAFRRAEKRITKAKASFKGLPSIEYLSPQNKSSASSKWGSFKPVRREHLWKSIELMQNRPSQQGFEVEEDKSFVPNELVQVMRKMNCTSREQHEV